MNMTAAKQIEWVSWVSVKDYLARELMSEVKHEHLGGNVYPPQGQNRPAISLQIEEAQ
jgi:hypothetical protein